MQTLKRLNTQQLAGLALALVVGLVLAIVLVTRGGSSPTDEFVDDVRDAGLVSDSWSDEEIVDEGRQLLMTVGLYDWAAIELDEDSVLAIAESLMDDMHLTLDEATTFVEIVTEHQDALLE